MAIPDKLIYQGVNKEFQFRDKFIMPLLVQLGFAIVVNYHGQREFGRDVIFGDIDRFGHIIYYGMQIKYETSISLSDSHSLIQDAEQATHNPFKHPQTGREEFISCFYVANAGEFSEPARDNFFNTIARRGIRDARLLNGNALLLLHQTVSLNRNAHLQEQLMGLLQEVRRNKNIVATITTALQTYAGDPMNNAFPILRFRNSASANYLNAPFPIPDLPIDLVDEYWELTRILNDVADSVGSPIVGEGFGNGRAKAFRGLVPQLDTLGVPIEKAVISLLTQLNNAESL